MARLNPKWRGKLVQAETSPPVDKNRDFRHMERSAFTTIGMCFRIT